MNAIDLFAEIIKEHTPEDIWQESPLIDYRSLGNTNRGEIGEEFVRRYLKANDVKVSNGNRTSEGLRSKRLRWGRTEHFHSTMCAWISNTLTCYASVSAHRKSGSICGARAM